MRYLMLLLLALLFTTRSLIAQNSPFLFGIKIGGNLSNATEQTNYSVVGKKSAKLGYQIGAITEYNLNKSLYIGSGLSLSVKGTIHKGAELWIGGSNAPVTNWEKTTNQTYLQLPLTIGYKFPLSETIKIRVNAGLYVAYGIGGTELVKTKTTPSNIMDDEKIKNKTFGHSNNGYYSPYDLDRKDYGTHIGCGVQYKKIILSLDYEMGLLNIYQTNKTDVFPSAGTYKNRNLALAAAYVF